MLKVYDPNKDYDANNHGRSWCDTLDKGIKEIESSKVTVYTAYIGMKVRLKYRITSLLEADKIGEIIQISGVYRGAELHSHQCIVKFEGLESSLTLNIGYDNKFDLLAVNDSNVVTIKNAKVGAEVIHKRHNKNGKIISIARANMVCTVDFTGELEHRIVYIGNQNKYNLIFNSKTKEDGTKRSNDKHTQKSIKVQRFNSKIREGDRERGFIVQCRASRAKCKGYNIQNKESIIKSKKRTKCIA